MKPSEPGDVERAGEAGLAADVELVELGAGGRAADFDVELAGGRLRVVAGDGQNAGRRAGCDRGGVGGVAQHGAAAGERAALDVGDARRIERALHGGRAAGLRVVAGRGREGAAGADRDRAGVGEAPADREVAAVLNREAAGGARWWRSWPGHWWCRAGDAVEVGIDAVESDVGRVGGDAGVDEPKRAVGEDLPAPPVRVPAAKLLLVPWARIVPPFWAWMVPLLVQLVPFKVMVPEARPSPMAAGSAAIVPWLLKATTPVLIEPAAPVMVRLAPNVTTGRPPDKRMPLVLLPPKRTVPALPEPATPSMVWGAAPMKNSWLRVVPATLPRGRVAPFRIRSPVTLTSALKGAMSSGRGLAPAPLPSSVTPARVPLVVTTRALPSAAASVPPLTVPPARFTEPVLALRNNVCPTLFRVPTRLTVDRCC